MSNKTQQLLFCNLLAYFGWNMDKHQNLTNECSYGCGHATQDLTGKEAGPATYLGRGIELR